MSKSIDSKQHSFVGLLQAIPEDQQNKILDTIYVLNVMLDVEKPFTIIVHDPSGI